MICPHCKKPIDRKIDRRAIVLAKKLRSQGYSLRDIEFLLKEKGYQVSFSSLGRIFREHGV